MKRYDLKGYDAEMLPISDGDYVLYADALDTITAERAAAMAAILAGCPNDSSYAEIILRRAWERVRTMRSNV